MGAGEGLPEDHADRPDVAPLGGLVAAEALGRDVRQGAGDVADGGQRVGLVELRKAEVEDTHRGLGALLDEHVRGLDVAMDDSPPMRVREPVEHLRGDLDCGGVVDVIGAEHLAQGAAADVFVRDVDMAAVAAEVVRPHAALVTQTGGGLHLTGRSRRALPLARHDLQRDVEACLLVARQPDRARAAASERLERAIPVEDE